MALYKSVYYYYYYYYYCRDGFAVDASMLSAADMVL